MSEYAPVPVDAARQIAVAFDKAIVVILAWDREHNVVHTTTYGIEPNEKAAAAKLGDILTIAAGCDLSKAVNFEDWRTRTAAEWAREKDDLLREINELKKKLNG